MREADKVKHIPIKILRVVDPDINNHGILALVEMTPICAKTFGARYFITRIGKEDKAWGKVIGKDRAAIREMVEEEETAGWAPTRPCRPRSGLKPAGGVRGGSEGSDAVGLILSV